MIDRMTLIGSLVLRAGPRASCANHGVQINADSHVKVVQ